MASQNSTRDSWDGTTQEIAAIHLQTDSNAVTGDPRTESERYAEGCEERMLAMERTTRLTAWRRICFNR
ncbi:MAG TPA: hypothetical protein VF752_04055 [Thermoleophilaceae bacterium]